MFPVIVFLIFAVVFDGETVDVRGGVEATTYYVPAIMTLSIISATMQTLAMTLVIAREDGRLKRGRGTPMPAWVFIAGRIGNSIVVALLMLALLAADRRPPLRRRRSPGTGCRRSCSRWSIGAASFCCLGIALTAAIPSQDAAAPIVNALLLPLYFLSGVFIPEDQLPERRHRLRQPSSRSATSSRPSSTPTSRPAAPAISWDNLAVVALWGVAGLLLAIRFFRWTPRSG